MNRQIDQLQNIKIGGRRFIGITHMGLTRKLNEDRYLIKGMQDNSVLIAVADGLGGGVSGDYAAEKIRKNFAGLKQITKNDEQPELDQLVRKLDRTIYAESQSIQDLEGTGSTFVGVLLRNGLAHWVHVGDSRLYFLQDEKLTQVTEDQTLARFLLEEGEITPDQVPTHYSRHVMDQCVGCGYSEPETGNLKFHTGDLLVLSTDGLHKQIPESTLNSILNAAADLETKAKSLVKAALDAGGTDDITLVMAQG
jgi:serine/threonine protein phosphatase PrpC